MISKEETDKILDELDKGLNAGKHPEDELIEAITRAFQIGYAHGTADAHRKISPTADASGVMDHVLKD